jgi:hypothetical protein
VKLKEPVRHMSGDDDTIRAALAEAHVPSLMLALVHLTGDLDILRGEIRPQMAFLGDANAGISEVQQAQVRAHAFEVRGAWARSLRRPDSRPPCASA